MPYVVEILAGGFGCVEQPGAESVHGSGCLSIPSASLSKMGELEGEQEPLSMRCPCPWQGAG